MGQLTSSTSSSADNYPTWLSPVENVDQFQARIRSLLKGLCLSRREQDWFQSLFSKFASASDTDGPVWHESDLVEFIGITLPSELKPTLAAAGPLLFRCMLRLGSFPYQNQPASKLTVDIARVAVIILLRRHERNARPIGGTQSLDYDEEQQRAKWLRRLLFQCMATKGTANMEEGVIASSHNSDRNDAANDEHLLQAHRLISCYNKERDESNPKVVRRGPPIIPVSDLPSSQSQNFSGYIPRSEFEALTHLLLASQLYLTGNGPEHFVQEGQLDSCVDCILSAFTQPNNAPGIPWESFNLVLSSALPNIVSGFTRLLAPFVVDHGISYKQIDILTKEGVSSLLRQTFIPKHEPVKLSRGNIFNPPVLAELATFLPEELPVQTASVIYTARDGKFEVATLKSQLTQKHQPFLLLVSGTASDLPGFSGNTPICVGAFLPGERDEGDDFDNNVPCTSVFQLRPTHQVSNSTAGTLVEGDSTGTIELKFNKAGPATVRLVLDEKIRTASFSSQKDGTNSDTYFQFQVDAVDLVGFASGKTLFDLPLDKTFFVSITPDFR
ncbi:hypothetical protein AAE478_006553 [Parahypoxylon ruwenzoriense]